MRVIARLEFELAYYDSTFHHFNHYTMRTPPPNYKVEYNWITMEKYKLKVYSLLSVIVYSSSSTRAYSMDFPDSLSPSVSIIHCSWQVFQITFCLHRADVNKLLLVDQYWHDHESESIGEHHLWVCPFFSSNVLYVLFFLLGWFLR